MGDVVQASYLTPDVMVIVIRGPLDGDAQKILVGAIDQGISNRTTWGKIFIADLSQASPLEESDVQVLRDIQGRIRKSGGVLAVVDPHRHLPQKAKDLEFFYSTKEAITRYEKDVVPIDVQIYLSDESAAQEVQFAVEALLDHFGVSDLQGGRPEIGSWYRRLYGRTSRVGASEAGENLARSMDIQMIERHQTDIDAASAQVVATLMAALEKTPSAVIQAGSTIFVKHDGNVISRQLTQDEMVIWKLNPDLFRDPLRALTELQRIRPESTDDTFLNLRRFMRDTSLLTYGESISDRAAFELKAAWNSG